MGERVCTQTCVEECPAGFECTQASGLDPIFICLSLFPELCLPCESTQFCANVGGGKCVVYGPDVGAFCGAGCDDDKPCPAGYACLEAQTTERQTSNQCVLAQGECTCSEYAVAKERQTGCAVTNEFGTCTGWRTCANDGLSSCSANSPTEEICDGIDNNCDGTPDEGTLCYDDNECTEDSCQAEMGCLYEPTTGSACNDGDLCTHDDLCQEDSCVGLPMDCDDGNPCTADFCDTGECIVTPGNEGEPCQDDDPCTTNEHCKDGICVAGAVEPQCVSPCGDGICSMSPADVDCPEDCGPCGDGVCGIHEAGPDGGTCPKDCLAACGNGKCEGGESVEFCLVDCSGCGDGFCGLEESPELCPGDCPVSCGDGECGFGEGPLLCPADCSPPCGDGVCQTGEDCFACPSDCAHCGDSVCGAGESKENCPQDCDTPCGNGVCDGDENPQLCAMDCGPCGDGTCGISESLQSCPADCWGSCGDGKCQPWFDETKNNCPVDCVLDKDGDGVEDAVDNCTAQYNPKQEDFDEDGTGDLCDLDDDGDGDLDATDCAPLDAQVSHLLAEVCDGKDNDCDGEIDGDATCPAGQYCLAGECQVACGDGDCDSNEDQCTCPADCGEPCQEKECGDDGCGGVCGECLPGPDGFCWESKCYQSPACFEDVHCGFLHQNDSPYSCLSLVGACNLATGNCRDPQAVPMEFNLTDGCFVENRTDNAVPGKFECMEPGEQMPVPPSNQFDCLYCNPDNPFVWTPSSVGNVDHCFIDQEQNPVLSDNPGPIIPDTFPWGSGACVPEADTTPAGNQQDWQHPQGVASGECWICRTQDLASRYVWSPAPDGSWGTAEPTTCADPSFTIPDGAGGTMESMLPVYGALPGEGRCVGGSCRGLKHDAWLPIGFAGGGQTYLFDMNASQYVLRSGLGGGFGHVVAP